MQDLSPEELDARLRSAPLPAVPPAVEQRLAARMLAAQSHATRRTRQLEPPEASAPQRKEYRPMAAQQPPRRTTAIPAVAGAIVVMIALLTLYTFHNTPRGKNPSVVITNTPTATTVPPQWQAAYMGADNHLHFVTPQGRDTTGPALPVVSTTPTANNAPYFSQSLPSPFSGVSADGRYLAFIGGFNPDGSGIVAIFDVVKQSFATVSVPAAPDTLLFAPQGSRFVVNGLTASNRGSGISYPDAATKMIVVDAATHTVVTTNFQANQVEDRLLGWSDATHVIAVMEPPQPTAKQFGVLAPEHGTAGPLLLAAVDVATGAIRSFATISKVPTEPYLSPDGTGVFIAPNIATADAELITVATGAIKALPQISNTFAGALQNFAYTSLSQGGNWAHHFTGQPASNVLALSLTAASQPADGLYRGTVPPDLMQDAGVWLLDLNHDQATRLDHAQYPLAWTPDGASLFVCSTPTQTDLNSGKQLGQTLSVFSPVTPAGTLLTLTTSMQAYFGLVYR